MNIFFIEALYYFIYNMYIQRNRLKIDSQQLLFYTSIILRFNIEIEEYGRIQN